MRFIGFIFLLVLLAIPASTQELRDFVPPNNFDRGLAAGRAPLAVLWNLQLYIGYQNSQAYTNAVEKAKDALKPGETAHYGVIVRYAGGTTLFQRLERIDEPTLKATEDKTLAVIKLSKSKYGIKVGPLPALSKEAFNEAKKSINAPLTYADHCFATEALNAVNGYSVNATDVAGTLRLLGQIKLQDLTKEDLTARAVTDGTIILTAKADESTYRVFNIETGQLDAMTYPQGEFLKSLGNTVWLYTRTAEGAEYTTIYAHLDKVDAKPGQQTKRAESVLGKWKTLDSTTINLEIWRVHGQQQRFFRDTGEPKPYCVLPVR